MIEVEGPVVRRSKRQKVQVDYSHLLSVETDDEDNLLGDRNANSHRKLARAVLKWPDNSESLASLSPENLSTFADRTGFHVPCVVRRTSATPQALGIRLPRGKLTVQRLGKLLGHDHPVNTIDVATQLEGPVYSMEDWVSYFYSPATRKPLLNVVSLDLAETPLENMVSAPSIVRELDLVGKAWPHTDHRSPKVQLYALMSVANCYTDFHIDFGGSSVWYHMLSGRKVFLLVPPSKGNLLMFEEWASSEKQGSISFAERAIDCQKVELFAGDTLFIPGGWPHSVATPIDSLVIGGNFLTGCNLRLQFDIWHMEERLKVRRKFRYPFYKPLMWHTASYYLELLRKKGSKDTKKKMLSVWEREGIISLCSSLQFWIQQSVESGEVPDCIHDPNALLQDLEKKAKLAALLQMLRTHRTSKRGFQEPYKRDCTTTLPIWQCYQFASQDLYNISLFLTINWQTKSDGHATWVFVIYISSMDALSQLLAESMSLSWELSLLPSHHFFSRSASPVY